MSINEHATTRFVWYWLFIVLTASPSFAQREKSEDAFAWYSQALNIPLGKKWMLQEDASIRWYGFSRNVSFLTLRAGIEYKIAPRWFALAGYTFFDQFQDRAGFHENRFEHRPYQQLIHRKSSARFVTVQRFRIEERFFSERMAEREYKKYHFFRLRYMSSIQITPFKVGALNKLYLIAQMELMFHLGNPDYVVQSFDQYRFYPHVGYKVNSNLDFHAGYMFYYQINMANTHQVTGHTLRLSVIYTLNKKQSQDSN